MTVLPLPDPYAPLPSLERDVCANLLAVIRESDGRAAADALRAAGFVNESAWWAVGKTAPRDVDVTVYVPCFNAAAFLPETISAIRNQTVRPAEIIVVDDGSTDGSIDALKALPVRLIRHDSNRGLAAARNTALAACNTPYIAGIDADTVPEQHWLERMHSIVSGGLADGAGGRLIERFAATVADLWRKEMMGQHHGKLPSEGIHLFGCNSLVRTDVLKELGGFNESCRTSYDDIDLSERMIAAGFRTRYDPAALCYHCRRDTPRSIAESAYRWRLPPFEMRGVFRDPALLSAKWITEVREALREVESLFVSDRAHLLFPSFYSIFQTIAADARSVFGDRRFPDRARALLEETVAAQAFMTESLKNDVTRRIAECFEGHGGGGGSMPFKSDPESAWNSLAVALSELPSVYRFSPAVSRAIEESHARCLQDEAEDVYGGKTTAVLLGPGSAEAPSSGGHAPSKMTPGSPVRSFVLPPDSWSMRAFLEEICSLSPARIDWMVDADAAPNARAAAVSLACMLLRRTGRIIPAECP